MNIERLHHKFTDTDADPHNATRGMFFSHIGWLLVKKHSEIRRKGETIDMSDLKRDPIVMFQKKYVNFFPILIFPVSYLSHKNAKQSVNQLISVRYYGYMMPTFCFIIPTLIPYFVLNETLWNSWFVAAAFRYVLTLHATWLVNSAAHIYGMRRKNAQAQTYLLICIKINILSLSSFVQIFK